MTRRISRVESGVLYLADQQMERKVAVGSGEWFTWLMEPTTCSFVVRDEHGNLTVRKERRQRGGEYWTAYRRIDKRLRKAYLGKSLQLTRARLERATHLLVDQADAAAAPGTATAAVGVTPGAVSRTTATGERRLPPEQPLLITKLTPPPLRSGCLHRVRLTNWLTAHLSCPVLLVTAPAGFGKTTLLAEWIATRDARDMRIAWVALDKTDNDPAQFWSYVSEALCSVLPDLPLDTISRLRSPRLASPKHIVATLVNAVATIPSDFTLILDDYHAITSRSVHDGLTFLLDHIPARMRLIIASRAEPPLALARLRARGQLAVLDAADLRCTPRETATFLRRVMGLRLVPEAEAALGERTEGWLAGLQLAALALRHHGETPDTLASLRADSRFVESFLADEVLRHQPAEVQRFLLYTSLLDELTGPLCGAVTGRRDGEAMLRHLASANVFVVPLDEHGQTYRYHQLFAEVLRNRLREAYPGCEPALYRRAADWYASQGRCVEAIRYALAADDHTRAANLMNAFAFPMIWEHGEIATLYGWLAALPEPLLAARPNLAIAYAYVCLLTHRNDEAERWITSLAQTPQHPDDAQRLRGEITFVRVHLGLRHGDVDGSIALAEETLDHLDPGDEESRAEVTLALGMAHHRRGNLSAATRDFAAAVRLSRSARNRFLTSLALGNLAAVSLASGCLLQAERGCREAIRLARNAPGAPAAPYAGLAYHMMAEVLYEWNELDDALRHAEEAMRLLKRMGDPAQLSLLYELLMRLHAARGDMASSRDMLEAMRDIRSPEPHTDTWQAILETRWHLLAGDLAAAALWTPTFYPTNATQGAHAPHQALVEYERATLARLRLMQDRFDDALEIIGSMRPPAELAGKAALVIELRALEALAWNGRGDAARALDALKCALKLAQPSWYIRLFVDLGEPMAALLRRAAAHGVAPRYVQHLLAAFQAPCRGEALTPQEQRILQLIASGSSNSTVAQQLMVSESTVKTHLYHVYQKLGAHNRSHAIALARERGVLAAGALVRSS